MWQLSYLVSRSGLGFIIQIIIKMQIREEEKCLKSSRTDATVTHVQEFMTDDIRDT